MTDFPAFLSTSAPWLNPAQSRASWRDGDTYGCDVCGKSVPVEQLISMVINCVMMGDQSFPMFQCNAIQHYGCCMEHAVVANLLCTMEHMTIDGNYAGKGTAWTDAYNTLYAQLGAYVLAARQAQQSS